MFLFYVNRVTVCRVLNQNHLWYYHFEPTEEQDSSFLLLLFVIDKHVILLKLKASYHKA